MKDYDFRVDREQLFRKDGTDSVYDALFDKDTGEQLSVVSRDYQLVTHTEAVDAYHKVFDSMDESVEHYRFETMNRGKKFRGEFKLPNHEFDVAGDHFIPTLIAENSIDRTRSFISRFGLYRMICENGCVVPLIETQNIKIPHFQTNINLDEIGEQIKTGLFHMVDSFKNEHKHMNEAKYGKSDIQLFLEDEAFPVAFKIEVAQYMIDQKLATFETARTSNLFKPVSVEDMDMINGYVWWNVLTAVSTHKIHSLNKRMKIDNAIAKYIGRV